jgi:hypothetical protein
MVKQEKHWSQVLYIYYVKRQTSTGLLEAPTFKLSQSFLLSIKALAKLDEVRNLVACSARSRAMPEHSNSTASPTQNHDLNQLY